MKPSSCRVLERNTLIGSWGFMKAFEPSKLMMHLREFIIKDETILLGSVNICVRNRIHGIEREWLTKFDQVVLNACCFTFIT